MQVSAKVDYGLRALVVLGSYYHPQEPKLLKGDFIAKNQAIPLKFLESILTELKHNGFIISQRGAEGGYRLSRAPEHIILADVVRVLDGPLAAVRGIRPEQVSYDAPAEGLAKVWLAVRVAMRTVLEHVTLADVLNSDFEKSVKAMLADPDVMQSRSLYSGN